MTAPPRLQLALTPAPILKLERLSRHLGAEIFLPLRERLSHRPGGRGPARG